MANLTLLDIAKMNGSDAVVGLIEEAQRAHPEIEIGAARTIRGLNYKTLVRTAVPTVAFRNYNEGATPVKSTFENRLVETFVLDAPVEVDCALADTHEDGWQACLALEGVGVMEGALTTLAKCFYYGTDTTHGDAKGFPGLLQAHDSTNMVVDAAGTTATTGSSVWAVKFGPQHVQWIAGNNGQLQLTDPAIVRLTDSNSNPYDGYRQAIKARPGLQIGSVYSVGRIKKLTADSTHTLTDAFIAQLLEKFPVGIVPDVLFMNRRSLRQLQSSRTATNPTGSPAPFPSESFGIPIRVTDSIVSTEALTL